MPFVTDIEVLDAVTAAGLHKYAPDASPVVWQRAAKDGNAAAYAQIRVRLRGLGYTQAQVDGWEDGAAYQKSLAIYETLIRAAGPGQEGSEWRTELDYWRGAVKELTDIVIDDEVPDPSDLPTAIGSGDLSTAKDTFVRDTPDTDSRIGNLPTRW